MLPCIANSSWSIRPPSGAVSTDGMHNDLSLNPAFQRMQFANGLQVISLTITEHAALLILILKVLFVQNQPVNQSLAILWLMRQMWWPFFGIFKWNTNCDVLTGCSHPGHWQPTTLYTMKQDLPLGPNKQVSAVGREPTYTNCFFMKGLGLF